MAEFEIARATEDDIDTVVDLHLALNEEMCHYSVCCPPHALRRPVIEKLVDRHMEDEDFTVWLAWRGDECIGFISAVLAETPVPHSQSLKGVIPNVYIVPEWRQRRVGSALVERAMAFFEDLDVTHVELSYLIRNEVATYFWASHGFVPESVKAVRNLKRSS